jgi:hypothetical protein
MPAGSPLSGTFVPPQNVPQDVRQNVAPNVVFSANLSGTVGNDNLTGDGQNTNFLFAGNNLGGTDVVSDSGGTDRISFHSLSDVKLVISSVDANNIQVAAFNLQGTVNKGTVTVARSVEQLSASDVTVNDSNANDSSVNPAIEQATQIQGNMKAYILAGTAGDDTIDANTGTPDAVGIMVFGGAGNDVIIGHASAMNILYGGAGNDTIIGGAGEDKIYGGAGNDSITGGAGSDVISLGKVSNVNEGNDVVYIANLSHGPDTITDFSAYTGGNTGDRIQFITDAKTALDDGASWNNNALLWDTTHNSNGAINLTNGNIEAVYVDARSGAGSHASNTVNGTMLANYANGNGGTTTAIGADALFVVATNDSKTLIYAYAATAATVGAVDFTLVATVDTALSAADAQTSIVLA